MPSCRNYRQHPTSYGVSLPVNAGMTYEIELAINQHNQRQLCHHAAPDLRGLRLSRPRRRQHHLMLETSHTHLSGRRNHLLSKLNGVPIKT